MESQSTIWIGTVCYAQCAVQTCLKATKHVAQVDSNNDYDFAARRVCYIYISCCSELKFLATNITDNLHWHIHICSLFASLNKVYYITKSLRMLQVSKRYKWFIILTFNREWNVVLYSEGELGMVKLKKKKSRKSYSINIWGKDSWFM